MESIFIPTPSFCLRTESYSNWLNTMMKEGSVQVRVVNDDDNDNDDDDDDGDVLTLGHFPEILSVVAKQTAATKVHLDGRK